MDFVGIFFISWFLLCTYLKVSPILTWIWAPSYAHLFGSDTFTFLNKYAENVGKLMRFVSYILGGGPTWAMSNNEHLVVHMGKFLSSLPLFLSWYKDDSDGYSEKWKVGDPCQLMPSFSSALESVILKGQSMVKGQVPLGTATPSVLFI